jgi:hypothetical protein
LWFVAYLWVYTVLLYAAVRVWPSGLARLRALADRGLGGFGALALPIAWLAGARLALGALPSTHALVDDWYNHAVYLFVFVLGFALAGTRAPWAAFERARWHALGFALLGWAALVAYQGFYTNGPPPDVVRFPMRAAYAAEQWLAIVAALGFARRHLNHDSAARRYLTTAIFPVYILHQTVIVIAAHTLKPVGLPPATEAVLLALVTAATCLLGYEAIRRAGVLRPLFGLARIDRRDSQAPVVSRGTA